MQAPSPKAAKAPLSVFGPGPGAPRWGYLGRCPAGPQRFWAPLPHLPLPAETRFGFPGAPPESNFAKESFRRGAWIE
jgi:hypothetical protein